MNINDLNEKKKIDISPTRILIISLLIFFNVLSSKVNYLGALISIMELSIVLLYMIKGNLAKAYLFLLVFISSSLEEQSFVYLNGEGHNLYSVFKLPMVSIFAFYGVIYTLFILIYTRYSRLAGLSNNDNKPIRKFLRYLPLLFFTGLITGLITILVNDNGISQYTWSTTALITTSLRILALICVAASGAYLIKGKEGFKHYAEHILIELLFAFGIVATITVVLGWHGYYSEMDNVMLMPLASSLCPLIIIIPVYFNVKRPIYYYIIGIVFTVESMFYNSVMGSKFYLIPILAVFVYVSTAMRRGKLKSLLLMILLLSFLLVNADSIINIVTGTDYGFWKFNFSLFINSILFSLSSISFSFNLYLYALILFILLFINSFSICLTNDSCIFLKLLCSSSFL